MASKMKKSRKLKAAKKKKESKAKSAKQSKPQANLKKAETRKHEIPIHNPPPIQVGRPVRGIVTLTIQSIRGETAIGDLLVAFPRTREVLVRNGLRLEADDAGDIYMTLDAFSAMNGLKTETLVQDIIGIAKEPPVQQAVPQLAAQPAI
jgi:hypothetical protein